jgi:hypothetical protein
MRKASNERQRALDARWTKDLREIFNLALLFQLRSRQSLAFLEET